MKVDFSAPIADLDGKTATENGEPITLAKIAIGALMASLMDARGQPEQLEGTMKVRLGKLAQDIFTAADPLDLSIEDLALLKERIGRAFGPLAVMRAWALLEGPPA